MERHTLDILEFDAFLALLAQGALTAAGAAHIRSMAPLVDPARIERRQALHREMMRFHQVAERYPRYRFASLGDCLRRVRPAGAVLEVEELIAVRELLDAVAAAAMDPLATGDGKFAEFANLRRLLGRLRACSPLLEGLRRAFDNDGHVLDSASPELGSIRKSIRRFERDLRRQMDAEMRRCQAEGLLQEPHVTIRNNRHVVPVRREMKSSVPGVVHDHSDTGRTLFVEPEACVPLGNELMDARLEERDEIRRVLAALSGQVRSMRRALALDQAILARLDATSAVAAWALACEATLPTFADRLCLRAARHPLLERQLASETPPKTVVPLDVAFDQSYPVLVITGSNSGGKTVALKTAALLTVAAQTGLPIPAAAGTTLPIFDDVLADIGDEQSIDRNLSTFTGHLDRIATILRRSQNRRCLVVLDEIGTGTDPVEGGALACALLDEFSRCPGNVMATTHLGVVKTYVHGHDRMENACVRFNERTLAPEYVLEQGRPGASHALTAARRVGLSASVLERAEALLGGEQLRLESIIEELGRDRRLASEHERELRRELSEVQQDRGEVARRLDELKRQRKQLLHDAYAEANGIVENTRRRMESVVRELREAGGAAEKADLKQAREKLASRERTLRVSLERTMPRAKRRIDVSRLGPGDEVWVVPMNSSGRVLEVEASGKRVRLDVGGMTCSVETERLEPLEVGARSISSASSSGDGGRGRGGVQVAVPQVPLELNLVGRRVAEALEELDRYLDQARLAGLETVRIVHGYGTGRLMTAVHEWLGECPFIAGYRRGTENDPGKGGVTWVDLG